MDPLPEFEGFKTGVSPTKNRDIFCERNLRRPGAQAFSSFEIEGPMLMATARWISPLSVAWKPG
jgi:hypothetical protein